MISPDSTATWFNSDFKHKVQGHTPLVVVVLESRRDKGILLQRLFDNYGVAAHWTSDGCNLLATSMRIAPSLIVMSAEMPDQSSWLTVAKLRHSGYSRDIWMYGGLKAHLNDQWARFANVQKILVEDNLPTGIVSSLASEIEKWKEQYTADN